MCVIESRVKILRSNDDLTIENHGTGCTIRILSPPESAGRHEVYELRFSAGRALSSLARAQETREHLTVIEVWGYDTTV